MKTKKINVFVLAAFMILMPFNQIFSQKSVEYLNRGLVAIRQGEGYYLKWRLLGHEPYTTAYNIYRNGEKINEEPLSELTSYLDEVAPLNAKYQVRAVIGGKEMVFSRYARIINQTEGPNAGYFDIPLNRPPNGVRGGVYTPNDVSVGDLTGDGEYEIVIKWDPSNAKDNSHSGHTDNVLLDAYTLDGVQLWRIDLGQNIRAGAHYTQFLVYDFDGDGRAEIMVKTGPGTKDGTGNYISKGIAASALHDYDYSNSSGYILSGPEYITVFDGLTGEELATSEYWPLRGAVNSWGNNEGYGNRVDRFNATVAYIDGERPSAIFQRGYYDKLTMAAWDWRDGKLKRKWTFNSKDPMSNNAYSGQGNHSIHVIDADGDGLHDIVTGSAVISGDGTGMHTSGLGHGDATHVTYMIKDDPRPLIFMPHESGGHGVSLRYADNGQMLFNHRQQGDIGRGAGAEIDPETPGFHFWASGGLGLFDINGTRVGSVPNSINFVVWWDGNLSRNLLNSNRIDKWNIKFNRAINLLTANGASSINGTKSTPVLSADLFGDWREEVILRRNDDRAIRVYTTTMPTTHKLYTFMHDPVYRVAISWQNSSYNQPPHPGFYVASDMDFPPPTPDIKLVEGKNVGSGIVIKNLKVNDIPNAESWSINKNLLTTTPVFSDMSFYIKPLPDFLDNAEWILTSMASRRVFDRDLLTSFEVKSDAIIYVLHNDRISEKPEWLEDFNHEDENVILENNAGLKYYMDLFSKEVKAGQKIELGVNSNDGALSSLMYLVAAVEKFPSNIFDTDELSEKKQNISVFPNPVRNTATINFDIEEPANTIIELFDVNGRLIRVLKNDFLINGSYNININAKEYQNGVYIIKMMSGNKITQERIIIIN